MTSAGDTPRGVVIIGGGISGLSAAHHVVELAATRGATLPVTLLEAGARLGGTIASERIDGFLIEAGADSFLTEKPAALALCRRLGIEDRLIATRDERRRTLVVHRDRLHALPDGFLLVAPTRLWPLVTSRLFTWRGKLRMACDLILPRGGGGADESLAAFVRRRLGREALERVAQPLAGGIYTGDPERLSLAATMPRFLEMEQRDRSIILGMRRQARRARTLTGAASGVPESAISGARWSLFASFAEGMQTLITALARRLPEGAVRLGTRAFGVTPVDGGWRVALADGSEARAAHVILATPAFVSAELLRGVDAALATELDAIRYASSATVTLAFDRASVPCPLDAFGFVVPAIERRSLIACSFSSVKYAGRAPADGVLLRVFSGGVLAEDVARLSDAELTAAACRELADLLGITGPPRVVRVHRHPRAMPQYDVGHLGRVRSIETRVAALPGLALAGSAYHGVGIPDCIASGERAAAAAA